jgi:hypothetical protein
LLAVAALAASVTTRYAFRADISSGNVRTLQKSSPELSRQRLLQNAAVWVPPMISALTLQEPGSYARVVPAPPPIPNFLLETSLYNRPPPSALLFS